ncbi:hypothetical protein E4U41_000562 [Claviceps citrina]|nr:hypothetical protein E4U41_000562 [Claviceps citrina]
MSELPGQPSSAIDDTISQNLNGLITPARTGFNANSAAGRTVTSKPRQISQQACQAFQNQVLLPAWKARSDVLDYCALVAASPDPDDPEAALRDVEVRKERERIIDERLDPFSARFYPRETRTQVLATLVQQERAVENIATAHCSSISEILKASEIEHHVVVDKRSCVSDQQWNLVSFSQGTMTL